MTKKVVIIGGGWSGCAAAISAKKAGAENVVLLERADMLLGTGLVGGIMRNNGRFTATEEMIALGGGDLFLATDACSRHKNIEFPGHKHASIYDVAKIEPYVKKVLEKLEVEIHLKTRVSDVVVENNKIVKVVAGEKSFEANVFVETTGTAGPQANCSKYGNGCAMCILRCPTFGPRVSVASKAGVTECDGKKKDGSVGAMSGSCKLFKESLSEKLIKELNEKGVAIVPIPKELQKDDSLGKKACQQYALKEFAENIVLLDTGHAKLMSPYYPLDKLRQIPGFEEARYEDPYSGGVGNSMRYFNLSPRNDELKVEGVENLFCGGEKAGLLVGHTEAIVTGTLAGHNAVRFLAKKDLLTLPTTFAVGDAIKHVREQMKTEDGMGLKYTFSGSVYFERMKKEGLYTTDINTIKEKIKKEKLENIFSQNVF